MKKLIPVLAILFVATAGAVVTLAQSGTRGTPPQHKETFEQRMWKYLNSSVYQQWSPAGDNGDFRESQAPHGALVKTYMNRKAASDPTNLVNGSVIIKENYSPDEKLMAITLMYKSDGYNAAADDWYWVKYMPNGQVAQMDTPNGKMAIAGKAQACIDCHAGAEGDDYLFFND